jgi:hypothetical protein
MAEMERPYQKELLVVAKHEGDGRGLQRTETSGGKLLKRPGLDVGCEATEEQEEEDYLDSQNSKSYHSYISRTHTEFLQAKRR